MNLSCHISLFDVHRPCFLYSDVHAMREMLKKNPAVAGNLSVEARQSDHANAVNQSMQKFKQQNKPGLGLIEAVVSVSHLVIVEAHSNAKFEYEATDDGSMSDGDKDTDFDLKFGLKFCILKSLH